MVLRVRITANNGIARGWRVIAGFPAAIIVVEMFPAAAGKPVVYDLTEAVVTEIFPAAIRIGGRLDAVVPIAVVISPIIVLIFAPADVVRMARVREGVFDGRILTGKSGRVGDFVHRAQHWFMLGRGCVPARIGKGVAVEIGSLVLEIGVVVYDSWATGILEPTGLPIPARFDALEHRRLVRRCGIGDSGNDLMRVEVLFASDLAPGDKAVHCVAPLHIFIFNLLHGTGVAHVVTAVHHVRSGPIAPIRAVTNIRRRIGISSLGPIIVIDVGEVIIIARIRP